MTLPRRRFGISPSGGGGGGGTTIVISDSGYITTGNITITSSFTQIGPDHTVAAVAGDILQLDTDMMANNTINDLQLDAATRVSGADANWWSTGTNTSRWPGGIGTWYILASSFLGPRGPVRYTVQAGDIAAGNVTVRLYGRMTTGTRDVLANTSYHLRTWLTNFG